MKTTVSSINNKRFIFSFLVFMWETQMKNTWGCIRKPGDLLGLKEARKGRIKNISFPRFYAWWQIVSLL